MATTAPELSVVLPAYEEAESLDRLLPLLQLALQNCEITYEILVIDSRTCRDATVEVCKRHRAIHLARTEGELYGHAIRTAQAAARGRYLIVMDADGSHDPRFIPKLWAEHDKADLVIASRYVPGGRTDNPAILILLSQLVNVVFRVTLGLKCADVSNSFRLYRGDDFRALTLQSNNFEIVEEILVKLSYSRPHYVIKEIPAAFLRRTAGKTKRQLLLFAAGYTLTLARLLRFKRQVRAERPRDRPKRDEFDSAN